jgi:glycosyltransferase involved in cell wall biosynthesis
MDTKLVAVCVCTYKRPLLLELCLVSIGHMVRFTAIPVQIIVIDNEPCSEIESIAIKYGALYVSEPRRGIPFARNKALAVAKNRNARWLAFIDDDQVVTNDWLFQCLKAMESYHADVVRSRCNYIYDMDTPDWRKRHITGSHDKLGTGSTLDIAATNGILYKMDAIGELRFDESILNGSDILFSAEIHKAGGKIVYCAEAIVVEPVHASRLTIQGQLRESYKRGFSKAPVEKTLGISRGKVRARLLRRGLMGIVKIAVSPLCILAGKESVLRTCLSGARNIAYTAGYISALRGGKEINYYEQPAGS